MDCDNKIFNFNAGNSQASDFIFIRIIAKYDGSIKFKKKQTFFFNMNEFFLQLHGRGRLLSVNAPFDQLNWMRYFQLERGIHSCAFVTKTTAMNSSLWARLNLSVF